MSSERFDDLSRALARGSSRRTVLRAIAAGVVGGVLTLLGPSQAEAGVPVEPGICGTWGAFCRDDGDCCSSRCRLRRCRCSTEANPCVVTSDCCGQLVCFEGFCDRR